MGVNFSVPAEVVNSSGVAARPEIPARSRATVRRRIQEIVPLKRSQRAQPPNGKPRTEGVVQPLVGGQQVTLTVGGECNVHRVVYRSLVAGCNPESLLDQRR